MPNIARRLSGKLAVRMGKSPANCLSFKSATEVRDGVVAQSPKGDVVVLAGGRIAFKRSGGVFRPMFRQETLPGSLDEWDDIEDMALRWKLFKEADGAKALRPPMELELARLEQNRQMLNAVMNASLIQRDQERANRRYPKFHLDPSRMDPDSNLKSAYGFLLQILIFYVTPSALIALLGYWLD